MQRRTSTPLRMHLSPRCGVQDMSQDAMLIARDGERPVSHTRGNIARCSDREHLMLGNTASTRQRPLQSGEKL